MRKKRKREGRYISEEFVFSLSMNLFIILNKEHNQQDIISTLAILLFYPLIQGGKTIYLNLPQFYR